VLPQMVTFKVNGGEQTAQVLDLDPETLAIRVAWPPTQPDGRLIEKTEITAFVYLVGPRGCPRGS
jgi:hypothetical protein